MKQAGAFSVLHFDTIDSTNAEAKRQLEASAGLPLWIVADRQTAGRGRLGRSWVSEPGNLYATLLYATTANLAKAPEISFVAAVAVHDAVTSLIAKAKPVLKWPNDCLIGGAKFCGVLPEVIGQGPTTVAIGCGINVAHSPSNTPYPVMHLNAIDPGLTVANLFRALASSMETWLGLWNHGEGFSAVRAAWLARCIGLNDTVHWQSVTGPRSGQFIDLAANGALMAKLADGTTTQINAGEVRFAAVDAIRLET